MTHACKNRLKRLGIWRGKEWYLCRDCKALYWKRPGKNLTRSLG